MAILLIALVSVAALVVGTLTELTILVWIALGLCLAGLTLIATRSVLRRRRAAELPEADDDSHTPIPEGSALPEEPSGTPQDTTDDPRPQSTLDGAVERRTPPVPVPGLAAHDSLMAMEHTVAEHTLAATLVTDRDEQLVRVVAGRRRYHLADCRLLGSGSGAEITRAEAIDEGFTACTACCG